MDKTAPVSGEVKHTFLSIVLWFSSDFSSLLERAASTENSENVMLSAWGRDPLPSTTNNTPTLMRTFSKALRVLKNVRMSYWV